MSFYLQYHNSDKLGWVPLDARPFLQTQLAICTRRSSVKNAVGGTVFVIVSLDKGKAKRYYLWECFQIACVQSEGDDFCAFGSGWQLMPPQRLEGDAFEAFRKACAYFVGFRCIDALPYGAHLRELADRYHRTTFDASVERFCDELLLSLKAKGDAYFFRGFVRQRLGRNALALADLDEAVRLSTEFPQEAERCRQEAVQGRDQSELK